MISFTIRPAPWDSTRTVVHTLGHPILAPPIFSIAASKDGEPNVVIYNGWSGAPQDVIATAKLPSSFSSKFQFTLRGRPVEMRTSQMHSGQYSMESHMGKLKWTADQLVGKNLELRDASNNNLATMKSGRESGEKILELSPGDNFYVELVVLSAIAIRTYKNKETAEGLEVVSSLLGA